MHTKETRDSLSEPEGGHPGKNSRVEIEESLPRSFHIEQNTKMLTVLVSVKRIPHVREFHILEKPSVHLVVRVDLPLNRIMHSIHNLISE